MKSTSLIGLMISLGAVLGGGCGPSPTAVPSTLPQADYVDGALSGSVTGYVWDPEAFIISLENCKARGSPAGPGCPVPTILAPGAPFYNLSVLTGSIVFMLDPTDPPPAPPALPKYSAAPTASDGVWRVENLPNRDTAPFFATTLGLGSLSTTAAPPDVAGLPLIAPAPYLPTVNLRPYFTGHGSACPFGEALQLSTSGVLEAVAKYRTAHGSTTAVSDFLLPAKYTAVAVFFTYGPALIANIPGTTPNLYLPAYNTTVQPSVGTRYHVAWKTPGTGDSTQSKRGFYVEDKATASSFGITVVVIPSSAAAPGTPVTYTPVDYVTDSSAGRPYVFSLPPIPASPGVISAMSLEMNKNTPLPDGSPDPNQDIPWFVCIN